MFDISFDILVTEQIILEQIVPEQFIPQQIVPELYITIQMSFKYDGSPFKHYDLQLNTEPACLMQNIKFDKTKEVHMLLP